MPFREKPMVLATQTVDFMLTDFPKGEELRLLSTNGNGLTTYCMYKRLH